MKHVLRSVLAATLLLVLVAGSAVRADVLQQIPSDALVVMRVRNLQEVSDKIAAMAKQWGVAEMAPALSDPLGALKEESKIQNGINTASDAAIVYVDAKDGDEEKSVIALLPVSDYAAFLGNFTDVQTEGDISTFTFAEQPDEPIYSAQWGDYAAISPTRALVETEPAQALAPDGLTAAELQGKDVVFYADFKKLGPKLLPKLEEARAEIAAEMEKELNQPANAKAAPIARAAVNQMLNAAERFLRETDAASFGVSLDDQGIQTTALAEFLPDTYLAKTAQSLKNTDATLVEGLPNEKYLFFGGMRADPRVVAQLVDDMIAPIVNELQGDDMQAVRDYIDSAKQIMAATEAQSYGMIAPTGPLGAGSLFQVVAVCEGDSQVLIDGYRKSFESQGELMKSLLSLSPPADDVEDAEDADDAAADAGDVAADDADADVPAQPPVELTYNPAAKTVAGVSFDQFQTSFNIEPKTPEDAQAAQMLALIYGPEGLNGYLGAVDDRHALFITGGDDALMEKAVASVKANETQVASAEHVQSVAQQLPLNRIAAMYLPLGQWVETGVAYAQQFGLAVPFEVPQNLPPIGMTVATDQTAVRVDGYVPSTLIENLVKISMQAFMGMQQGQPGAPEGM